MKRKYKIRIALEIEHIESGTRILYPWHQPAGSHSGSGGSRSETIIQLPVTHGCFCVATSHAPFSHSKETAQNNLDLITRYAQTVVPYIRHSILEVFDVSVIAVRQRFPGWHNQCLGIPAGSPLWKEAYTIYRELPLRPDSGYRFSAPIKLPLCCET